MPSIVLIKEKQENPKEWFQRVFEKEGEWELDSVSGDYHIGNIYLCEGEEDCSFEDMEDLYFIDWSVDTWIEVADGKELLYGYYNEELLEAEFVHIKNGKCIRNYREYEGEMAVDEGDTPEFENWIDVASYVDEYML